MASTPVTDVAEAQRLIEGIAKKLGYVPPEIYAEMSKRAQEYVQECTGEVCKLLGSSLKRMAIDVYTSSARCIFEILQNAEDTVYTHAAHNGQTPYIKFSLYGVTSLVVDCNQDAFTEINIRALCAIGQSSKTASEGYIGAKGTGFKSVFMAAEKVQIQSGALNFFFKSAMGESGLGMITPIWNPSPSDAPSGVTRLTLFLQPGKSRTAADAASTRDLLTTEFEELSETVLLFLQKLQRIEVNVYDDAGKETMHKVLSRLTQDINSTKIKLSSEVREYSKMTTETQDYYIKRHAMNDLPKSSLREYAEYEEEHKVWETSTVILAFPVRHDQPILKDQAVFAFLPVRTEGFQFIIQADWDTTTSRENIVTNSSRNMKLRQGVADAFVAAVLEFCKHPQLQYSWPNWLPRESPNPWVPFWKTLVTDLKDRLKGEKIIRPRSEGPLRLLSKMRELNVHIVDDDGEPLFADLEPELYISEQYQAQHRAGLRYLGLKLLLQDEFLRLVHHDLQQRHGSRMRDGDTSKDWHTRVAKKLIRSWDKEWAAQIIETKGLELIPLQDGTWASAQAKTLYFSATKDGHEVPTCLDYNLVSAEAEKNHTRVDLFEKCGVHYLTAKTVREDLLRQLRKVRTSERSIHDMRKMLHFLYLTSSDGDGAFTYDGIKILDHKEKVRQPLAKEVHFFDNEPLGAHLLLAEARKVGDNLGVYLIHPDYMEEAPDQPDHLGLDWKNWLSNVLQIRHGLRLLDREGVAMSEAWRWISKNDVDGALLLLRSRWPAEGEAIIANDRLKTAISELEVSSTAESKIELEQAFLPTTELRQLEKRYMEASRFPDFIQLPEGEPDAPNDVETWNFLSQVGLGVKPSLFFFSSVLMAISEEETEVNLANIVELYLHIDTHLQQQDASLRETEEYKEEAMNLMIWVPPKSDEPASGYWTWPFACLWDAPGCISQKAALLPRYTEVLTQSRSRLSRLGNFFQEALSIGNISLQDLIKELRYLAQAKTAPNLSEVIQYYEVLRDSFSRDEEDVSELRKVFESDQLICVRVGNDYQWRGPSDCLWSSAVGIEGKFSISEQYDGLKTFFVKKLKVESLNLDHCLRELIRITAPIQKEVSVEQVKCLIKTINTFLMTESKPPSPGALLTQKFLPIKPTKGSTQCQAPANDFVIVDREGPYAEFRTLVPHLDFDLSIIAQLRPFFRWVGIEDQYLSRLVMPRTRAQVGQLVHIVDDQQDVKLRAKYIMRVASYCHCSHYLEDGMTLHKLLTRATTYMAKGISAILVVGLGGKSYEVTQTEADLHLEEKADSLAIYVPKDETHRDSCFHTDLPKRLGEWLMSDSQGKGKREADARLISLLASVLTLKLTSIDLSLRKEGVPEVVLPEVDQDAVSNAMEEENIGVVDEALQPELLSAETETAASSADSSSDDVPHAEILKPVLPVRPKLEDNISFPQASPSVDHVSIRPPSALSDRAADIPPHSSRADSSFATPLDSQDETVGSLLDRFTPPSTSVGTGQAHVPDKYAELLSRVVEKARSAEIPYRMATHDTVQVANESLVLADRLDWEEKKRIGAAGELYVYELLRNPQVNLPSFDIGQWQSKIRHFARRHPEYEDMEQWTGTESSDLVYQDAEDALSSHLARKGYLPQAPPGKGLKYHIEVKTTRGPCETPFFVSVGQKKLMEQCQVHANEANATAVYVIFRVYNLGQDDIGLRIYVNPWRMELSRQLRFSPTAWSVTPCTPRSPIMSMSGSDFALRRPPVSSVSQDFSFRSSGSHISFSPTPTNLSPFGSTLRRDGRSLSPQPSSNTEATSGLQPTSPAGQTLPPRPASSSGIPIRTSSAAPGSSPFGPSFDWRKSPLFEKAPSENTPDDEDDTD